MKVFLIFLACQYCIIYNNSLSYLSSLNFKNEKTQNIKEPERNIDDILNKFIPIADILKSSYIELIFGDDPDVDNECKQFWDNIYNNIRVLVNSISKK